MDEDTDYIKLPIEDQCIHKVWKARVHGYEECSKIFRLIDDEKSPEWNKYINLVKKFVIDSNAAAQEKGLEAVLAFVENAAIAGKTVNDVMSGLVTKCIAAPKAKTKELAVQIILMYIEIEKQEAVQEELIKGTEAKNPKIVTACLSAITLSLREFGSKIINLKPLIKKIPALLEDRDKNVREETKALAIEIYRWIGPPFKQQLNILKPVQLSELEVEFNNLKETKAVPKRFIKSQKLKISCNTEVTNGQDDINENYEQLDQLEMDPYELLDPVDILSKLSKDFFDKIESKKWQDRKEALEALENLTKNPKLENGDYGEVVRALKKVISKDTNVLVISLAVKCLTGLATGLKKRFHVYAASNLSTILEKFREKKPAVVQVLRDCADSIFLCISIEIIMEDVLAALENKNPAVKAETAAFLARCFAKTPPPSLTKKLLKSYMGPLLKILNEPDPHVRDNSAEALGTAMKLVGEKTMMPFLVDLDNLKITKIKESAEKAVILGKWTSQKLQNENSCMVTSKKDECIKFEDDFNEKIKRQKINLIKKAVLKKPTSVSNCNAMSEKKCSLKLQTEKNLSDDEINEMASEIFPSEVLAGLIDGNWKIRLSAMEQLHNLVKQMDTSKVSSQLLIRVINKKPGLKDTNFQVLKLKLELIKFLAEECFFSSTVAEYCLADVSEKLGDPKNCLVAVETLNAISEATSFEYVSSEVITYAFNQKNPKVQVEALNWLSKAILEFGCNFNVKTIIDNIKKAIVATNQGVRNSGINLIGTIYLFKGKDLLSYFDNEKAILKQQIEQECEKYEGCSIPVTTKGKAIKNNDHEVANIEKELIQKAEISQADVTEHFPRIDISNLINEPLLIELSDKNWKIRNEALQKINNVLTEAKYIKGSLGELPQGLSQRLIDSNSKITQTTLGLCEYLAIAMGSPIKQYIRILFPGFIQCLGDSKAWIRTAAISCINTWGDQCGYKEFFDGEIIGDSLKSGSPILRSELWAWLSEKLPTIPVKQVLKEELIYCLPTLYNNLEDRNVDVRKNAQEASLGFMIHLSFETMARHTEKLKPGSKNSVMIVLDKVRSNLPVKPLPKKTPAIDEVNKTVKSSGAIKAAKSSTKIKGLGSTKPNSTRKSKDDEVDTSPLLVVNNLKHQRVIDEQKLKVLKWNFTTPREEFVELLKELMTTANVNKTLMSNMFHSDFRYHLKAIESLTEDLATNNKALMSNLDLILKWLTLRFFDTNPSVLLKGLDYLQTVFNILIEEQYHMLENEAASFIPYLIIKIGDPKDAVRNGVRALFKQIALVYPVSKLFSYVMEGLKSKNARQRTECLDQLGSLIENYGVSVCQPSPSAALKEVAKQIADRDNSVRNAALNCIVQAYFLEGEKVYKLIGQISEKDQSLLDERIKRAAKNKPIKSTISASKIVPPTNLISTNESNEVLEVNYEEDCEEESNLLETENEVIKLQQNQTLRVEGPFGLDMELLQKIELDAPVKCRVPKLLEPTMDLNETIETMTGSHPIPLIPMSPPKLLSSNTENTLPVSINTSINVEDSIERTILGMASLDLAVAIQSINTMEQYLKSSQVNILQTKEDKFVSSVIMQLKILQTYPLQQGNTLVSKGFRTTFMIILTFYDTGILGKNVQVQYLKDLVDQMIGFLAENKLEKLNDVEAYVRVINTIVLKIIDLSDHSSIICVLIKLLHERANSNTLLKCEELVMKCLWKIVKTIPNWAGDLNYDIILLEVHNFFKDYPTSWWKKQKKPDTPMRTIKTVLHSMTRVKGSTILSHLTLIKNPNESELRNYLTRLISTFKPDEMNTGSKGISKSNNQNSNTQKHVSKFTQQQLSEIFKKIGSKHHAQEGLSQLYDFKLQYPEADVQPFLAKSHQYFQDFIEKGLKNIDLARKNQNLVSVQNEKLTAESQRAGITEEGKMFTDPIQRLERLRALEAQCLKSQSNHNDNL